jgi:hypothetical protein
VQGCRFKIRQELQAIILRLNYRFGWGPNGDGWDMAGTVDDISGMSELQASTARSGHRVRLADGKRHDVPNFVLIDPKTNKLGYAVVWLIPATFDIHCFLPGAGG